MNPSIEEIHESLINGQRKQAVSQIQEYDPYVFFDEYKYFLERTYGDYKTVFKYFSDITISYHRIVER